MCGNDRASMNVRINDWMSVKRCSADERGDIRQRVVDDAAGLPGYRGLPRDAYQHPRVHPVPLHPQAARYSTGPVLSTHSSLHARSWYEQCTSCFATPRMRANNPDTVIIIITTTLCFKKFHPLFVCAITYFILNRFWQYLAEMLPKDFAYVLNVIVSSRVPA